MVNPSRGEIWLADLSPTRGHEQAGKRPVLVISDDGLNHGPAQLVMVLPFSSKIQKSRNIPAHFTISPPEGGVEIPSVILCDQLRTISKDRLVNGPWGRISDDLLQQIETVLRYLLGF